MFLKHFDRSTRDIKVRLSENTPYASIVGWYSEEICDRIRRKWMEEGRDGRSFNNTEVETKVRFYTSSPNLMYLERDLSRRIEYK